MMTGDPERAAAARGHPSLVDAVLLKPVRIDRAHPGRPARPDGAASIASDRPIRRRAAEATGPESLAAS